MKMVTMAGGYYGENITDGKTSGEGGSTVFYCVSIKRSDHRLPIITILSKWNQS